MKLARPLLRRLGLLTESVLSEELLKFSGRCDKVFTELRDFFLNSDRGFFLLFLPCARGAPHLYP